MKLKRIVCLLLAAAVLALSLVSCGSGSNKDKSKQLGIGKLKLSNAQLSDLWNDTDTILRDVGYSGQTVVGFNSDNLIEDIRGYNNEAGTVPIKADTEFRIGSLTKSITAVAVQMLIDSGKMKETDTLDKFFDASGNLNYLKNVTVAQLMNGSVSFGAYFWSIVSAKNYNAVKLMLTRSKSGLRDYIKGKILLSGVKSEKSTHSNYFLLGYIIERVSGEDYKTFVQKNIFDKLKMKNSGFVGSSHKARGLYTAEKIWVTEKYLPAYNDFDYMYSCAGITSTAEDMMTFYRALANGELTKEKVLGEIKTSPRGYNFGLEVDGSCLICSGSTPTSYSAVCINPERNEIVINLSNSMHTSISYVCKKIYLGLNSKLNGIIIDKS